MTDMNRRRLAPLLTRHARNDSSHSIDSDSSESSPDAEIDDEKDTFMIHVNDSQSTIGPLTFRRENDMDIDVEFLYRTSPVKKLPAELLITIFSKLTTTNDLRNCMLASYSWAVCAVNILWHRPLCNKWHNLVNVARTLSAPHQLFPYHEMVKRLNLSAIADKVNDGTVRAFFNCKAVERLTLTSCVKLTDQGVEGLVDGTKRLQALDVTDLESLTDRSILRVAKNCPKLQGLNVTNCSHVTDESLAQIAFNCTQLKRLKLNGVARATDASILEVARNCRSILEIDLQGCYSVGSASITALLTNLPQLRELRLSGCIGLDSRAFTDIAPGLRFDALRVLDLTACDGIGDDAIARIIPAAPRLRNLVLAKCRHITDVAVRAICALTKNLHYIHLGHCQNLTDQAVVDLVQQCNRIRYIDLACCSRLTDASVRHLAKLPKLRRIGLVKCQNLTDASIIALARGPYSSVVTNKPGASTQFVSLERVHLSYCTSLTLKGITELLLNCPRLTHLSLTGVQAFLRDDLTRFCREAPTEFTHIQRDVFCVFSGDGVIRLRDYLERLAIDEQERELQQQGAVDEPVMGPNSPDADSMSDGTIDGADQQMDYIFGITRPGLRHATGVRARPRPRSLHDLPHFHVDMPLLPGEQMTRVGPWTPNAPLTPEIRAQMAPAHLNLINSRQVGEGSYPRTRGPLATPGLPLPSEQESIASRSQSRRHTVEAAGGFFGPGVAQMTMATRTNAQNYDTDIFDNAHMQLPIFQTSANNYSSSPPPPPPPPRPSNSRDHFAALRPDNNVSSFEINHESILSTIPATSRGPSRNPSRSHSPQTTRVQSRSRISNFFNNVRAASSSPFSIGPADSSNASGRSARNLSGRGRDTSGHREEARQEMIRALTEHDAQDLLQPQSHHTLTTIPSETPRRGRDLPVLPVLPSLPSILMEQVSTTPETPGTPADISNAPVQVPERGTSRLSLHNRAVSGMAYSDVTTAVPSRTNQSGTGESNDATQDIEMT